ncbi:MAG: NfeD family protein [Hyphomicrobium sp.]
MGLLSLLMPIAGVSLALYGAFNGFRGVPGGWTWLTVGVLILAADLIIDERWSYWIKSAEPDLNDRGEQLVGQIVTVVDAIEPGGRGSVRVADTVWVAEGATAEVGAKVRVSGCKGTVLSVEVV